MENTAKRSARTSNAGDLQPGDIKEQYERIKKEQQKNHSGDTEHYDHFYKSIEY
jgi:hypothetical protein